LSSVASVISRGPSWTPVPSGIQLSMPVRKGVRPVSMAARDGEQSGEAA
jgi:hypothetical protein